MNAQFSIHREQLAFAADPALGELDCQTIFARPLPNIVECLLSHTTVTDLLANLPGSLDDKSRLSPRSGRHNKAQGQ